MKRLLLSTLLFSSSFTLLGQGTIMFNNRVAGVVVAPVYQADPGPPWAVYRSGNTPEGFPAGTTVYGGAPLSGTGYTAQLFCAPGANQFVGSLIPALGYSTAGFQTGPDAGFWVAGSEPAIIPGAPEGTVATLQVRVWDNQGGTITTWQAALASSTQSSSSPLFNSQPLGGISPPPQLIGLQSFNLYLIPEPSAIDFAMLIGLVGLAFWRHSA